MRVGVLGINHKLADLKLRELLAKICQHRLDPGQSTHGEHSFVLLSTCNRTEVYFSSEELSNTHSYLLSILRQDMNEDFDQKLYSFFGQDCLLHLSRVAAGLDSAIVAETEIQGQVKVAYETAHQYQRLPYELHYLFQKSLGIAKKARAILPLKPGLPDLEHAVFQMGQQIFEFPQEANILFVGASGINEKILVYLKKRNFKKLSLCNRSEQRGKAIAEKYQVSFVEWNTLSNWMQYDWVITGTKSPEYLIRDNPLFALQSTQKLIMDLAVPRNVDPLVGSHQKIKLLNIDQLNGQLQIRKKKMTLSLDLAEEFILHTSHEQVKLFQDKAASQLSLCIATA
jgi:glutamyl-tRNA reductase